MNLREIGILVFLTMSVLISGCATGPKDKFTAFYDRTQHERDVKVLFDTLIISDIEGKDVGISKTKNDEARGFIEEAVKE